MLLKKERNKLLVYSVLSIALHILLIEFLPGFKIVEPIKEELKQLNVKARFVRIKTETKAKKKVDVKTQAPIVEDKPKPKPVEKPKPKPTIKPKIIKSRQKVSISENIPKINRPEITIEKTKQKIIVPDRVKETIAMKTSNVNEKLTDEKIDLKKDFSEKLTDSLEEANPVFVEENMKIDATEIVTEIGIPEEGAITDVSMPGNVEINLVEGSGNVIPISVQDPEYPEIAQRNGWEGDVVLKLEVNSSGHDDNVIIDKKSAYSQLNINATRAAKKWRVRIVENQIPRSGLLSVTIKFRLR